MIKYRIVETSQGFKIQQQKFFIWAYWTDLGYYRVQHFFVRYYETEGWARVALVKFREIDNRPKNKVVYSD